MQRAIKLVFTGGSNIPDSCRFLQHALGLGDNLIAYGSGAHTAFGAFKKIHTQFTFQFFNRYTQRWLTDIAALRRLAKMLQLCKSSNIAEFGKCHWAKPCGTTQLFNNS